MQKNIGGLFFKWEPFCLKPFCLKPFCWEPFCWSAFLQYGQKVNPNYHPLSENRDFSRTEPPFDLRPVCEFKFVNCGPVEKNRALYLSRFSRGGPTKSFRQKIFESQSLEFFAFTSKFYNKSRTSFQVSTPNTQNSMSVSICKRNEVNWAQNDQVRAVSMRT